MTEKFPLVTLCVVTYGWANRLEKTLEPLINQTYPNTHIIVSDDQSPDNTRQVIENISQKHPRVTYRKNIKTVDTKEHYDISSKNIPAGKKTYDVVFHHYNRLLESGEIKGEFVLFCHQDDMYSPEIVQKQVEFLLANPTAPCVFTQGNIINQQDQVIKPYPFPQELATKNIYTFMEIFTAIMRHGNFLIAPSCMFRASIFKQVGLFDDQGPFGGSDDLEMWLRIAEKFPIGILHQPLINWRTDGRGKKYHTLRTEKADFFKVMDYYLHQKRYAEKMDVKELRQYKFQKDFDNTLRAMNFLLKGQPIEAKKILGPFSAELLQAYIENPTLLRTKGLILKILLWAGMVVQMGKPVVAALKLFI